MKKNLLLLIALLFCFSPFFGQTLYTSTSPAGYLFNPGLGALQTPIVTFDDVLIPSGLLTGKDSIRFTKLKFGIFRAASAPAVTVKFYYTLLEDTATTYDNAIKIPPVLIGSVDLPENGASAVGTVLALGDSLNTLFAIKIDTNNLYTGYQALFLGLSFSVPGNTNGWGFTVPGAPESENANVVWDYDVDDPVKRYAYNFGASPVATFYIQAFGTAFNTLPITLTSFTARKSAGNVNQLNWSTSQELNTSYFSIERSKDGQNYTEIGRVTSAGFSNTARNYSYTDKHPLSGNNYYRLRSVDKDNAFTFSDIRTLRNEVSAAVNIFPNPVKEKLSISISVEKAIAGTLSITDMNGRLVYSKSIQIPEGISTIPVEIGNNAAGTYILKIQSKDDVIIQKFNKQ